MSGGLYRTGKGKVGWPPPLPRFDYQYGQQPVTLFPVSLMGCTPHYCFVCYCFSIVSMRSGRNSPAGVRMPAGRFFDDDRGLSESATGNERRSEVIAINVVILFGTSRLGSYSIVKELRPRRVR